MATILKKAGRKASRSNKSAKTKMTSKRKQAIEKAISFWEKHSVDLSNFKFDREEANGR